jgi:hypothetical protein
MPARTNPLTIGGSRSGASISDHDVMADRRNFELDNDPNALARHTAGLQQQQAADAARLAPQMGQNLSGVQATQLGQIADQGRSEQDMLAEALRGQAYGTGYNPAIAQLNAATATAQGHQQSLAAGTSGYDMSAAHRAAAMQGAALGLQGAQQGRVLQAQQMAFGRDAYSGMSDALRGQDLATRDAQQANGIRQGQLDDSQRSANDAMTQFYLAEQDRLRRAQVGANMGFEQQDAANKLGYGNTDLANHAYNQQVAAKDQASVLGAMGTAASAAATYSATPDDGTTRQKRNPYDPGDY